MTAIELVGNALCLDFANTVNDRPVADRDWLRTPDEAVTWAAATGHPIGDPEGVAAALPEARTLREAIYRVFRALAVGEPPPRPELDVIATTHAHGLAQGRLEEADGGFRYSWPPPRTARTLLWEVAASAVELLIHGPLDRLGECDSCCWLFLDTSKNRRRRWCSMTTCGTRDKSRRYYARRPS
ncbi:ABATE domain-containing protein [Spongiactinospora sp. TRM90649]|uniref:CGNR zinc finger domain-containing protein n=1 Tax=Spongiactinospora sp. TRM90649 TaxID=3031114 RepID=UPI0023FA341F|nr:ABATE domain-containing protein [Spongiactinospora sp. TRM90649]MDF5752943.1 ABATE domain-containing protein [Spongiactinospora sp. TRM90649]